jgi:transmembrane sensor
MNPSASENAIDAAAAAWVARRDAGLSAAEETAFAAWRARDPRHAAALARFERAWSAVARPRRTGAGAALALALAAGVRRRRRQRGQLAAAAAVCVLGFLGVARWRAAPPPAAVAAAPAAPERRVLADGSVAELRPGAAIAVDFAPALRRVRLQQGEALFTVSKDAARPFVVEAGGVAVRAVGTAFSVRREAGTGAIEVTVTEGRVALEDAARPGAPVLLGAGEHARLAAAAPAQVAALDAAQLAHRLAWRLPHAEFSGTPLAEVIAILNARAIGTARPRYVIDDPALARTPLSGRVDLHDAAAFERLLAAGFGVAAEPRDAAILLRRAGR